MQKGRKSAASLAVPSPQDKYTPPEPPDMESEAQQLWRSIVEERVERFFSLGDLPLLQEYCLTMAVYLPRANQKLSDEFSKDNLEVRDKLLRAGTTLATKLRICVSSRTRSDTAGTRDSVAGRPKKPW